MSRLVNITFANLNYAQATITPDQIPSPLIFLTPQQAYQLNEAKYLHIAATGIFVWDILNNLRNDLRILTDHKIGVPTLLYFIIRLTLLVYAIGRAVLLTAQVDDCNALQKVLSVFLSVCVAGISAFFYLRVVAVYSRDPYITAFFGLTWLGTVAMSGTLFVTFGAAPIGNEDFMTKYCQEHVNGRFLFGALSILLINDFLIYIAIAYRIYRIFMDYEFKANWRRRLVILFFGTSLPVGSKIVLLESQLYCLIIVVSKTCLVILISKNLVRNSMYFICHIVLVVVLSSRFYRELRGIGTVQRQQTTDFQTGNLTSAEFRDRAGRSTEQWTDGAERSMQQRVSRKTADIENDTSSSIDGTRTSFVGSIPTYISDNPRNDDFNMRPLHSSEGEQSQQSRLSCYDRSDTMNKV